MFYKDFLLYLYYIYILYLYEKIMREKILKVLNKRLENYTKENMFINTNGNKYYINPISISKITTEKISIKGVSSDENNQIEIKQLYFELLFDDGEPNFLITTKIDKNIINTEKTFKLRLFLPNIHTIKTKYEILVTTHIQVGHINFALTNEERDNLISKCEEVYEKQNQLLEKFKDKELLYKLNKRLK